MIVKGWDVMFGVENEILCFCSVLLFVFVIVVIFVLVCGCVEIIGIYG